MSATTMHRRKYTGSDPVRRTVGWIVVVTVHVVVAWALISGTARKGLEIIKKPLEAVVIQEVIIPPPPPPPKQIKPPEPQAPKTVAPPPPFVPPPEVRPPTTSAPTIESVQVAPPAPVVIAPPPPLPPPPTPAPPAPVGRQEIGVACPTQVRPTMPNRALKPGEELVVRAQATIRNGNVVEVVPSGGNSPLRAAVVAAMKQYKCISSGGDIIATQEFIFRQE